MIIAINNYHFFDWIVLVSTITKQASSYEIIFAEGFNFIDQISKFLNVAKQN